MRVNVPGFVKIYGDRLLRSTLWVGADPTTKVVWITMLALSDQNGTVLGSLLGLAHASNVSLDETSKALDYFRAPDPHSQTKDHEGRRIEDIEGGWLILNYAKYREYRTESQVKQAARKQKWRKDQKGGHVPNVPPRPAVSRAEAEAEADKSISENQTWLSPFVAAWEKASGGYPVIGKLIKPLDTLVKQHGADAVLKAWERYLHTTETRYLSASDFAAKYGQWHKKRTQRLSEVS